MKAVIQVWLKKDVLDPQGIIIMKTLNNMDFNEVKKVRQGKIFELDIEEDSKEKVHQRLQTMCKTLLANEVIENYKINLNN